MNPHIFRSFDLLQDYLMDPEVTAEQKQLAEEQAKYPFPHEGEDTFQFNLRMNSFKTESQILFEISANGIADYYQQYKGVVCVSDWSGLDIYEAERKEMRVTLNRRQVTKDICLGLLSGGAIFSDIFPAYMPNQLEYDRDIWIAAFSGNAENIRMLNKLYEISGNGAILMHSLCKDIDLLVAAMMSSGIILDQIDKTLTLDPNYAEAKAKAMDIIRTGAIGNLGASRYVLTHDMGL